MDDRYNENEWEDMCALAQEEAPTRLQRLRAVVKHRAFLPCVLALAALAAAIGIVFLVRGYPFYSDAGVQDCARESAAAYFQTQLGGEVQTLEIRQTIRDTLYADGKQKYYVMIGFFTGNSCNEPQYFGQVVTKTSTNGTVRTSAAMVQSYTVKSFAEEYMDGYAAVMLEGKADHFDALQALIGDGKTLPTPALAQPQDNVSQMTAFDYESGYCENTRKFYEWVLSKPVPPASREAVTPVGFFVQDAGQYYQYFLLQTADEAPTLRDLQENESVFLRDVFTVNDTLRYDGASDAVVLSGDDGYLVRFGTDRCLLPESDGAYAPVTQGKIYKTAPFDEAKIEDGFGNRILGGVEVGTYRVVNGGGRLFAAAHPTHDAQSGGRYIRDGAIVDVDASVENWAHAVGYGWVPSDRLQICEAGTITQGGSILGDVIHAGADLITGIIQALF